MFDHGRQHGFIDKKPNFVFQSLPQIGTAFREVLLYPTFRYCIVCVLSILESLIIIYRLIDAKQVFREKIVLNMDV